MPTIFPATRRVAVSLARAAFVLARSLALALAGRHEPVVEPLGPGPTWRGTAVPTGPPGPPRPSCAACHREVLPADQVRGRTSGKPYHAECLIPECRA